MERMRGQRRTAAVCLLLAAAALLSLVVPARALFSGGGFLESYLVAPGTKSFLAKLLFLFFLTGAGAVALKEEKQFLLFLAAVALAFCWLHVVFLPMAASALYLGFLLLLGASLERLFFPRWKAALREAVLLPASFLLGSSAVILLFCLMSLLGAGRIPWMRRLLLVLGLCLLGALAGRMMKKGGEEGKKLHFSLKIGAFSLKERLALSFILVMLLLQAGRMNIALDFDSLWYGVRSEYIVAGGGGIYDNPGLVGMVYVYSKGLEILTLPLCDLASHSYLFFFTLWLTAFGIWETYRVARLFSDREGAFLAAVLTAAVPGIMNMSICAKPDIITWLLQLVMAEFFFRYVRETEGEEGKDRASLAPLLLLAAGAYLLSLAMKPTAIIFSTAVFGMMGLYLLGSRRLSLWAPLRQWCGLLVPLAALLAVWGRTVKITGMPVTSVFTSLLERLGFRLKYPFASEGLPQSWEEGEGAVSLVARRLYQMLLSPRGDDMGHVIIAWGSSLLFFLLVFLAAVWLLELSRKGERGEKRRSAVRTAAHVIFWPFLAVNLVSLAMLYQVDGNYFMLLYSCLFLASCAGVTKLKKNGAVRGAFFLLLLPLLAFNVVVTAQTNWAWAVGSSRMQLFNKGRVNHEALAHERMIEAGNAGIWEILASDPDHRVISFGNHPLCLEFPCNVQSYKDITAPWGNVELVNTPEAFEEYMAYARTDYVYAEAGFLGPENWSWSYELLRSLIARGSLTDLLYENGNALARVAKEPLSEEEAAENLRQFDEQYRCFTAPAP